MSVTVKLSNDRVLPLAVVVGFSISNWMLGCMLFMIWWKLSASVSLVVWPYTSSTYRLYGSVRRYEVSTLRSNWSINRIARVLEIEDPMGKPSTCRYICESY